MKGQKILIVEDEKKISRFLELELKYEGYEVETAYDGREGLEKGISEDIDLIILDLMLPKLSGIEVCRRLRNHTEVPIIMLTAKDDVSDKVLGLDIGADDYMTKPFAIEELLARIRVNIKKSRR
jgi:DNA-binding response OmpR family regulator